MYKTTQRFSEQCIKYYFFREEFRVADLSKRFKFPSNYELLNDHTSPSIHALSSIQTLPNNHVSPNNRV